MFGDGNAGPNHLVYVLKDAFVLNYAASNPSTLSDYLLLVRRANTTDCGFQKAQLDALTDGQRYIFKTTVDVNSDELKQVPSGNTNKNLKVFASTQYIDARSRRSADDLYALNMYNCDNFEGYFYDGWTTPKVFNFHFCLMLISFSYAFSFVSIGMC